MYYTTLFIESKQRTLAAEVLRELGWVSLSHAVRLRQRGPISALEYARDAYHTDHRGDEVKNRLTAAIQSLVNITG